MSGQPPIKLDQTEITNDGPIVIIGANGTGKTRWARALHGLFIPATRVVELPNTISQHELSEQTQVVLNATTMAKQGRSTHISSTTTALRTAHSADLDTRLRWANVPAGQKPEAGRPATPIDELMDLWSVLFPAKALPRDLGPQTVTANLGEDFALADLSDGEKATLDLLLNQIILDDQTHIIDEPEVHLSQSAARVLWDSIETKWSHRRFIYITHDLQFALSRNAACWVVFSQTSHAPTLYDKKENLPLGELSSEIGVRVLAQGGDKILFCEGEPGGYDQRFYEAWYKPVKGLSIHAVGGCRTVRSCVDGLLENPLSASQQVRGIIDRDYRNASEVAGIEQSGRITVLPRHELESLLCCEAIFSAVHQELHGVDGSAAYAAAMQKVLNHVAKAKERIARDWIAFELDARLATELGELAVPPSRNQLVTDVTTLLQKLSTETVAALNASPGQDPVSVVERDPKNATVVLPGKELKKIAGSAGAKTWDVYAKQAIKCVARAADGDDASHIAAIRDFLSAELPIAQWAQ